MMDSNCALSRFSNEKMLLIHPGIYTDNLLLYINSSSPPRPQPSDLPYFNLHVVAGTPSILIGISQS